jgi:hypothetical protein
MLKKIMKAALAASLVIGFSAVAMAEAKVSGDAHAYFGQYTSGAEGYTAHFATASEGHISVTGAAGPLSGFLQVEQRDDRYATGNNVNNAQLAVTYKADALSVKIGTVSTGYSCTYAISNGLKTTTTAGYGTYVRCWGYMEQDGIQVNYAIPAIKGFAGLTIAPTTGGQKMAVTATGTMAGMVGFRLNSTSVTTDDYADDSDTAATDSYLHLAVKVPIGSMSISLDISSNSLEDKSTDSSNAIQFRAADIGPGTIVVTVASDEYKNDGNPESKSTNTGLSYLIALDKGARFDAFYAAKSTTPEGGDAVTSSYIGGGISVAF